VVYVGGIIAIHFVVLTVFMLYRRYNPSVTLLLMGMLMFFLASLLGVSKPLVMDRSSGLLFFDFFSYVISNFTGRIASTGLLIMLIGGYVEYMKRIKANDALIYVSMQPLSILKQYPYLAAVMIIPIGQILFMATPSAVALGLLLITTIYPVLVSLGVSKLTAVSVIAACTVFDMGPTSQNALVAANTIESESIIYFGRQLRVTLPLTVVMMGLLYIANKYFDRKDDVGGVSSVRHSDIQELIKSTPLYFALLPTLPLIFTVIFSESINLFHFGITVDIAPLILISLLISATAYLFRSRSLRQTFASFTPFWIGMGRTFTSVIVLIVCAAVFAFGLMNLGLIDMMASLVQLLGLNSIFVIILMTVFTFASSLITGSGVASFTAISGFVPEFAANFDIAAINMMIPVQLSAGLGRAASPIAIVIIAISEIAGVSPFDIARRNIWPFLAIALMLVALSYILI
jgi:DcuC family C4-dicarboxylate transporter